MLPEKSQCDGLQNVAGLARIYFQKYENSSDLVPAALGMSRPKPEGMPEALVCCGLIWRGFLGVTSFTFLLSPPSFDVL